MINNYKFPEKSILLKHLEKEKQFLPILNNPKSITETIAELFAERVIDARELPQEISMRLDFYYKDLHPDLYKTLLTIFHRYGIIAEN